MHRHIFKLCSLQILWLCLLRIAVTPAYCQNDAYQLKADSFLRAGAGNAAIGYFKNELKAHAGSEYILRTLGYLSIQTQNLTAGERYYRDALRVNPHCAHCYMNLAQVRAMQHQLAAAKTLTDSAIAVDPKDALSVVFRAKLKAAMGDDRGAIADYDLAIELEPANADYYLERADYNSRQGFPRLALPDYNRAVSLAPDSAQPYLKRSEAYYNLGSYNEAIADASRALQRDSSLPGVYDGLGAIYTALNRYADAVTAYDKVIALQPADGGVRYARAVAKYKLEDMDGACTDVAMAVALFSRHDTTSEFYPEALALQRNLCDSSKPEYYYQRGIALYNLGRYEDALGIYARGLSRFPDHAMMRSFEGNAAYAEQEYQAAVKSYSLAIARQASLGAEVGGNSVTNARGSDSSRLYACGILLGSYENLALSYQFLQAPDSALWAIRQAMDKALSCSNLQAEALYNIRGYLYAQQGKADSAAADFTKAIGYSSKYAPAYVNRALLALASLDKGSTKKITVVYLSGGMGIQPPAPVASFSFRKAKDGDMPRLQQALEDCNVAIALDEHDAFSWYLRGYIRQLMGEDGSSDLQKASALGYQAQ